MKLLPSEKCPLCGRSKHYGSCLLNAPYGTRRGKLNQGGDLHAVIAKRAQKPCLSCGGKGYKDLGNGNKLICKTCRKK